MRTLLNTLRVVLAAACASLPLTVTQLSAQHWAAGGPSGDGLVPWNSIAVSADFRRITLCGWYAPFPVFGAIYTSQDSGTTWTRIPVPNAEWTAVATSADGARLFAACRWPGVIITSSDISGTNWTSTTAPTNSWNCLACSANGTVIFAGASSGDGLIYSSADSGVTWVATGAPSNSWGTVACSADGSFVVAAADSNGDGLTYASTNSGLTWSTSQAPAPWNGFHSVACSADGGKLVAVSFDGLIYISTNSGAAWQPTSSPDDYYGWSAMTATISADGTTLAAYGTDLGDGTFISVTSTNLGATWILERSPGRGYEPDSRDSILALSADGNKAALAVSPLEDGSFGGVYTSPYVGPWKQHSGPLNELLRAVASSADSRNLVAAGVSSIYRSADSGTSWAKTSAPNGHWISLASSADGTRLVAVEAIKGLLYSSTDAGGSWAVTGAPAAGWSSVASSGDGTRLVAAVAVIQAGYWTNGPIYVSTNSGTTWTRTTAPITNWIWVGSSSDGKRLAALTAEDSIFTSPDYGTSWRASSMGGNALALSADGRTLIAADSSYNGTIYASTNLGTSWVPTSPPANYWSSLATSADGTTLIAAAPDGLVFMSKDSGATWLPTVAPAPLGHRLPVLCSADASTIIAVDDSSDIYTLQLPILLALPLPPQRPPVLSVASLSSGIRLSWLVPSSILVLQYNSDLDSTNWTDLAVSPELNFTNLHYEMTVSPSPGSRFYRLRQK